VLLLPRRNFLKSGALAAAGALQGADPIDRKARVQRHNPVVRKFDLMSPLSVGNGEFAFTADATGLQTFPGLYLEGIPLCTQSHWGWHSFPRPANLDPAVLRMEMFDTHGRQVGYPTRPQGQAELFRHIRENPHRLNLGRIGFRILKSDGSQVRPEDVRGIEQLLDLWTGVLTSRFEVEGRKAVVRTCCHPELDAIAVDIESDVRLEVVLAFPYGSPATHASDWNSAAKHQSRLQSGSANQVRIARTVDDMHYQTAMHWTSGELKQAADHTFHLTPQSRRFTFTCLFTRETGRAPDAPAVFHAAEKHWPRFWLDGGAVDLSGASDPRAKELERRVVLSEYLLAIQCAGSIPPQETGLTCNSWYGKFHLEMHWWHAVNFAYWNRLPLLERSLDWYNRILPKAREKATAQGYKGARWHKMVGPEAVESPSPIGPLLIWQQPHPIYYAELCYRAHPNAKTLARFRDVVNESAEFMADFAFYEAARDRYVLGPPLIPAQENHAPRQTWNPAYELEYWRWGLAVAQQWRKRAGLPPNPKWDEVRAKMSALPIADGVYLAHENAPDTYTRKNRDHPSMLAALGVLPADRAELEIMRRTLHKVLDGWKWDDAWGWDFPMTAMTAARLGEREAAIRSLFIESPKNRFHVNGHNYQRQGLALYLPGNGALLIAIAMMAAGWEDGPREHAPGFPKQWNVRWERLTPML
jgi:hypothetical protein